MIQKDAILDSHGALAIGYAIFTPTISPFERSLICSADIVNILTTPNWALSYKFANKWATVFACMSQTTCQRLELRWNKRPQILMNINQVTYSQLRSLLVPCNGIRNIEALQKMNTPQLQEISLYHLMGEFSSYTVSFPLNVEYINFCSQGVALVDTLHHQSIKALLFDNCYGNMDKCCLIQNVTFLHKINAVLIDKIDCYSRKRISQKKNNSMLRGRYLGMVFIEKPN